jgi:hypothetical protein
LGVFAAARLSNLVDASAVNHGLRHLSSVGVGFQRSRLARLHIVAAPLVGREDAPLTAYAVQEASRIAGPFHRHDFARAELAQAVGQGRRGRIGVLGLPADGDVPAHRLALRILIDLEGEGAALGGLESQVHQCAAAGVHQVAKGLGDGLVVGVESFRQQSNAADGLPACVAQRAAQAERFQAKAVGELDERGFALHLKIADGVLSQAEAYEQQSSEQADEVAQHEGC